MKLKLSKTLLIAAAAINFGFLNNLRPPSGFSQLLPTPAPTVAPAPPP